MANIGRTDYDDEMFLRSLSHTLAAARDIILDKFGGVPKENENKKFNDMYYQILNYRIDIYKMIEFLEEEGDETDGE